MDRTFAAAAAYQPLSRPIYPRTLRMLLLSSHSRPHFLFFAFFSITFNLSPRSSVSLSLAHERALSLDYPTFR